MAAEYVLTLTFGHQFLIYFLERSSFGIHKRVLIAHAECTNYFNELRVHKADLLDKGSLVDGQTSDIMGRS